MDSRAAAATASGSVCRREYQSSTVRVAPTRPLVLEADGEVLGRTPADFDVLPGVLRLKI